MKINYTAPITWFEYADDGSDPAVRCGTVWSDAPSVGGADETLWVVPVTPLPTDAYRMVVICRSVGRQLVDVHGKRYGKASYIKARDRIRADQWYGSRAPHSDAVWHAGHAAMCALMAGVGTRRPDMPTWSTIIGSLVSYFGRLVARHDKATAIDELKWLAGVGRLPRDVWNIVITSV